MTQIHGKKKPPKFLFHWSIPEPAELNLRKSGHVWRAQQHCGPMSPMAIFSLSPLASLEWTTESSCSSECCFFRDWLQDFKLLIIRTWLWMWVAPSWLQTLSQVNACTSGALGAQKVLLPWKGLQRRKEKKSHRFNNLHIPLTKEKWGETVHMLTTQLPSLWGKAFLSVQCVKFCNWRCCQSGIVHTYLNTPNLIYVYSKFLFHISISNTVSQFLCVPVIPGSNWIIIILFNNQLLHNSCN